MAKEFGSKADMISNKLDEVSKNSIWREHCTKELNNTTLNTNFNISNPARMPTLPEKPNYILPNTAVDGSEMSEARERLRMLCSIKDADQLPPDKYDDPRTSAQEYGWHSKTLMGNNPIFNYKRSACEITSYADKYYEMSGTTPFSRKDAGGK
eukprot:CAMPEP_0170132900 /NCGR_PEP_ID=MMETSP0033_2-20121228/949_1 /TAXON_ID=195969 /ORGANISM="Dolichomastix tenuilepis, Strain CCMP3274" /LENGTH=152 /DNA_ID=CAMNT_0010368349 /DNA_START=18 /DNA_END=476 /DNA_ORIENTATION=+